MSETQQHERLAGIREIRKRVRDYELGKGLAAVDDPQEPAGMCELLLAENGVQVLPYVRVMIGEKEDSFRSRVGMTVGEIRAFCGVPADWAVALDDEPVADNFPIIRDCTIRFRPGRPLWDIEEGTLIVGGHVAKKYTKPAPNQRKVLDAFQQQNWPDEIENPFLQDKIPIDTAIDALRNTVEGLNDDHQTPGLIRFGTRQDCQYVYWKSSRRR